MTANPIAAAGPARGPQRSGIGGQIRQKLDKVHLPLVAGLYLATVIMPVGFNLGPLHMSGVRLLLIFLIVPMSIKLISGAYGKVILPDVLFFLHFFWLTAALAVNNPDQALANAGSTGIEFIGGYVVGRACIRSRESFIALARALAIICICLTPFVLIEAVTGKRLLLQLLNSLPGLTSMTEHHVDIRMGLFRAQSVFAHPIHSGLFFIMTFSLCFIGLKAIYGRGRLWFIAIACAVSGFLALSSGAFLALVLQLGLIAWATIFRNDKARWKYLLALFAAFYVLVSLLSNRSPIMVFLSYATFSAQTAYWRTLIFDFGMQNIWANPWFGIGLNDWFRPVFMYTNSVDNFWLLMGMRYGIPGFLFLAVGYAWALWKIGTRDFDQDENLWNLRRAWMFSFIGLTFTITTVHIWGSIYSFVFFMFGAGMWMLRAEPENAFDSGITHEANDPISRSRLRYTRFPEIHHRS